VNAQDNPRTMYVSRRLVFAVALMCVVLAVRTQRADTPPVPSAPAVVVPEAAAFGRQIAVELSDRINPSERQAIAALQEVVGRRPDLLTAFRDSNGFTTVPLLEWATVDHDSDSLLLLSHRSDYFRLIARLS
jgi:hypothetical protein